MDSQNGSWDSTMAGQLFCSVSRVLPFIQSCTFTCSTISHCSFVYQKLLCSERILCFKSLKVRPCDLWWSVQMSSPSTEIGGATLFCFHLLSSNFCFIIVISPLIKGPHFLDSATSEGLTVVFNGPLLVFRPHNSKYIFATSMEFLDSCAPTMSPWPSTSRET